MFLPRVGQSVIAPRPKRVILPGTPGGGGGGGTKLTRLELYAWESNAAAQGNGPSGSADATGTAYLAGDMTNPFNAMYGYDGALAFNFRGYDDPGGSGKKVNFHRVRPHYADRIGGHRSELQTIGGVYTQELDYWDACAFRVPSGWAATFASGDAQTLWQWHSQNEFSPGLSLELNGLSDKIRLVTSGVGGVDADVILWTSPTTLSRDTWAKVILHQRKSFTGSPLLELWIGYGSGTVTYTKVLTHTSQWGWSTPGLQDWVKQGLYKWTGGGNYAGSTDRVLLSYGEFHQQVVDGYAMAVASLDDL